MPGVDRWEADCRAYVDAHRQEVAKVFREKDMSVFNQRTLTGLLRLDTDSDAAMVWVLVTTANKSSADTSRGCPWSDRTMKLVCTVEATSSVRR